MRFQFFVLLLSVVLSVASAQPSSSSSSSSGVHVPVFSGVYNVTRQNATGQSAALFLPPYLAAGYQEPLGPFPSLSSIYGPNDPQAYPGTWQIPLTIPFGFPFFGVNYTAATVTSKGFIYLGNYTAANDISNLASVEDAPDYDSGGAGFQSSRPVISFLHTAGGAVSASDVVMSNGAYIFQNYFSESVPAVSPAGTPTTKPTRGAPPTSVTYSAPVNSLGTNNDGPRFVIYAASFHDQVGISASVSVVLYASGLIEIFYYVISPSVLDFYHNPVADGTVSIGIQSTYAGQATHFSQPSNVQSLNLTHQTFSQLNANMQGAALSFRPMLQ